MSKKTSMEGKILDAAYQLFLQKGYRNTTMDDIAQELGMSKKTLYKYHQGKLELLAASFDVIRTKMTAKVEAIVDNRYLAFPLKLRSFLTVVATYLAPINPELFDEADRGRSEARNGQSTHQSQLGDHGVRCCCSGALGSSFCNSVSGINSKRCQDAAFRCF
jgi:AcrR family transcriptional regulator